MTLSNSLIGLLAILSLAMPGIFKVDGLAAWKNGLIALFLVALFSFLTVLAGGKLTSNFSSDWIMFAGVYGALLAGPGRPLDEWLTENITLPLPFLKPVPPPSASPVIPEATGAPSTPNVSP